MSALILTQAAAANGSGGTLGVILNMAPLLLIFVVFYFLLIRPQQQRIKAHAAKVASVKRGDTVVTGGGLYGKVTRVDDTDVEVEIATGVKVKLVKSTLADIVLPGGKPAND